jgi:hypothetical protein
MPHRELLQVDLSHERMVCYYSNIHKDHFPVDINNQLWVIDFDQAGVLPVSFMFLALERPLKDPLPREYMKTIPLEQTGNLKAMRRAAWWFTIGCGYGCGCSSSGFVSGLVVCSLLTDF